MSTILYPEIIFGPIKSRRLGSSLGINLLPKDIKLCSFDCIYCECGYNQSFKQACKIPTRDEVRVELERRLISLQQKNTKLDVITFAGNGEPTMHPQFGDIINDTIALRNIYFPQTKVSVLSNAMHLNKEMVFDALKKVDNNILKLDSANMETVRLINQPNTPSYSIERQINLFKRFEGDFIMQTMFFRGSHNGKLVDNTTENEVLAWLEIVRQTNPRQVMIYSIDRETPEKKLIKVHIDELNRIGYRVNGLGIHVLVVG